MQTRIFVTYSWKDMAVVDQLDADLRAVGIPLLRDTRDISYRDSIKQFMHKIRKTDHVLMMLSDSYLRSRNCMYEVVELLKDDDYRRRLIPVLVGNLHIFDHQGQAVYVQYWKDQYQELDRHMKGMNLGYEEIAADVLNDFKVISQVKISMWDFLKAIGDMKCVTFDELKGNNYLEIFQILGLEHPNILQELFEIYKMPEGEEREIEFSKFAGRYPGNRNLFMVRGEVESRRQNYKLARFNYERALEADPGAADAHHNLAYLLHNFQEEYDEARAHYEKALELNPEDAHTYNNYALLLKNSFGEYEEARACYEKAIAIDPSYLSALNNLAILLEDKYDDYAGAQKLLERVMEIDPDHVNANFNLGNLHKHHTRDYQKALFHYTRILEAHPDNAEAHNNLGGLYMDYLVDLEKARLHFEKALQIDPGLSVAKLNLLLLESRKGK